ncbi:hypothetical protein [Legionella jordanis]|uniref:Yip1 domain protein n=1 Tax=Legionella jordanis TaxID=456 RepID=A0A0W0V8K4_9GAMM|nr:hypothetical protein [Legionella jordanis]KTD16462.1 hypothetical protein Ljor_0768 [Legionella jordanis]RMX03988.1 hypothetical protein EAW55_06445 [Legionella jordanis]VEH12078.1 Uncharacterised protein [Legionella jordanis]HAT8712621.1 hypothetical protein [Legionella jordanis]
MWVSIFKSYWNVATFKDSPANTPYSKILLAIVCFLFFLLIIWQWFMSDMQEHFEMLVAMLAGISLIIAYSLYTFLLLKFNGKAMRLIQTLTALLASHFVIHVFAIPLLLIAPALTAASLNHSLALGLATIYLFVTLTLTLWQFLVTAHIYKYALEIDNLTAILASVGLLACNILTVSFWR